MTGGPPVLKAPLNSPDTEPVKTEPVRPGMVFKAKPRQSKMVKVMTKEPRATCMGAAGILARNQTPNGVPKRQPASKGPIERQCMSFQMPGKRWMLAATSSRKIDGTISEVGNARERAVTVRSEKPKPEYPRTMAARKTQIVA